MAVFFGRKQNQLDRSACCSGIFMSKTYSCSWIGSRVYVGVWETTKFAVFSFLYFNFEASETRRKHVIYHKVPEKELTWGQRKGFSNPEPSRGQKQGLSTKESARRQNLSHLPRRYSKLWQTHCPMENCIHIFCIDCIMEWLNNSLACPVCRTAAAELHYGSNIEDKIWVQAKTLSKKKFGQVLHLAQQFFKLHVAFSSWADQFLKLGSLELHKGFRSPVQFMVNLSPFQMRTLYDKFYNGTYLTARWPLLIEDCHRVKYASNKNLRRLLRFAKKQLIFDIQVIDPCGDHIYDNVHTVNQSNLSNLEQGLVGRNSRFYHDQ